MMIARGWEIMLNFVLVNVAKIILHLIFIELLIYGKDGHKSGFDRRLQQTLRAAHAPSLGDGHRPQKGHPGCKQCQNQIRCLRAVS